MKKMIAIVLTLVLVLGLAACAAKEPVQDEEILEIEDALVNDHPVEEPEVETEEPEVETEEPEAETEIDADMMVTNGALEILDSVWALYGDDEKFAIMGGNPEVGLMDMPGVWDPAMLENLIYTTQLPEDQLANVAEAATMIHMMNANTFTAVAYGLAEGVDAGAFAEAVRNGVQSTQWMCGFPELLNVTAVGEYVVVAYGLTDAMNPFQAHLAEAFPDAQTLYSETIG